MRDALANPPADWLQLLTPHRPELVWRQQLFTALVDRLADELEQAVDEQAAAILAGTAGVSELLE